MTMGRICVRTKPSIAPESVGRSLGSSDFFTVTPWLTGKVHANPPTGGGLDVVEATSIFAATSLPIDGLFVCH